MTVEIRDYTDDELRAIPPLVIEPGYTDENGVTRDKWLRNPFAPDGKPVTEEPRATLANRWSTLHWPSKSTGPAVADTPADPMDALLDTLDLIEGKTKKLWWGNKEEKNGAYKGAEGEALFPIVPVYPPDSPAQRALEDRWEQQNSTPMHTQQRHTVLDPLNSRGFRFTKLNESDEPMRYEDYVKLKDAEQREKEEAAQRAKQAKKDEREGDDKDSDGKPKLTRGD